MFEELMNVHTVEELDNVSIRLLDNEAFRQLQEDMVEKDVAFSRKDYWTADILDRRTADVPAVKKALEGIAKEPPEKKVLHVLQLITVTAPGASANVQRFLKRVTFA